MDVGLELRQARERRGLSLQQISSTTKISPRVLQAIEACDDARLPAPVFTRGFVKSYAAEVGLDPDDTMRRYIAQFVPPEPEPAVEMAGGAARHPIQPPEETPRRSPARILQGRFGVFTTVALVAVTALALIGQRYAQRPSPANLAQAPVSAAGLAPVEPTQPVPVATSGTAAPADALHIVLAPTGACWAGATIGEERLFGALLNAGERKAIDTASDVTLRLGDPATCAFTINGKPARVTGTAGQPTTIRVTRQNYAQFIAR